MESRQIRAFLVLGVLGVTLLPVAALAEPATAAPVGGYRPMVIKQPITNPRKLQAVQQAPASRTLFVHRCPEVIGCPITKGTEDNSITNTSSISSFPTATIGAFTRGDAVWASVMECVRETYAPFDIAVTDVDPGADPHYEVMVGGKNTDLRNDSPNAGGIAPFTCAEIPNAISFVFDVWGNNAAVICSVVAQESAHAFGLEHEMLAEDPMTYLTGPDNKRFRAEDAPCGEFSERLCDCGGSTQNSYEMIVGLFGPGAPTPPNVTIKSPATNKIVQPGFITRIDATDDVKVVKVELLIDGAVVGTGDKPPFKIAAPDDLPEGPHTIEARATDIQGVEATSAAVLVDLGPPCTAAAGCAEGDVCVMGVCVVGPGEPGGLGTSCQSGTECLSDQCVQSTEGGFCVEACDLSPGSCPSGFDCVPGGDAGVCFPAPEAGCCDSRSSPTGPALFALGFGVLVLRRRRRR